jgi:hypothetical protein
MKKQFYILIFLAGVFTFYSCKTANKLYNKGDYDGAVELAVKKLQKKPNDSELKSLLQDAYRYAVNEKENTIAYLSQSTNELKWEKMYAEYASLQKMYTAIHRSPEAGAIVNTADYSSYLDTYGEKAAEVRLQRGVRLMDNNDRNSFKNAYYEFQSAHGFTPTADLKNKMDEAYAAAVIRVVILPSDQIGYGNNYSYNAGYQHVNYQMRNFEDEIARNLQYNTGNSFVKMYPMYEAGNRNIQPDHLLDMGFTHFNIGQVYDERSSRQVSKKVVVKEIVVKPDSIVKEYATVYATITTTRRTLVSEGNYRMTIRTADGRWLWSDNLRGHHRWQTSFATYTGDARALSESDHHELNNRESHPPQEDRVIRKILDDIGNDVHYRIRSFYSRY